MNLIQQDCSRSGRARYDIKAGEARRRPSSCITSSAARGSLRPLTWSARTPGRGLPRGPTGDGRPNAPAADDRRRRGCDSSGQAQAEDPAVERTMESQKISRLRPHRAGPRRARRQDNRGRGPALRDPEQQLIGANASPARRGGRHRAEGAAQLPRTVLYARNGQWVPPEILLPVEIPTPTTWSVPGLAPVPLPGAEAQRRALHRPGNAIAWKPCSARARPMAGRPRPEPARYSGAAMGLPEPPARIEYNISTFQGSVPSPQHGRVRGRQARNSRATALSRRGRSRGPERRLRGVLATPFHRARNGAGRASPKELTGGSRPRDPRRRQGPVSARGVLDELGLHDLAACRAGQGARGAVPAGPERADRCCPRRPRRCSSSSALRDEAPVRHHIPPQLRAKAR